MTTYSSAIATAPIPLGPIAPKVFWPVDAVAKCKCRGKKPCRCAKKKERWAIPLDQL